MQKPRIPSGGPTVERIFLHYRQSGVDGWNAAMFRRFCEDLRCTEMEMGALLNVRTVTIRTWLKRDKFPGPVKLHLAMMHRAWLIANGRDVGPEIMPLRMLVEAENERRVQLRSKALHYTRSRIRARRQPKDVWDGVMSKVGTA